MIILSFSTINAHPIKKYHQRVWRDASDIILKEKKTKRLTREEFEMIVKSIAKDIIGMGVACVVKQWSLLDTYKHKRNEIDQLEILITSTALCARLHPELVYSSIDYWMYEYLKQIKLDTIVDQINKS